MDQQRVNNFVDKTIGSLCAEGVDIDIIIDRLIDKSNKFRESLENDVSSDTKKNYLTWYITFAEKRIGDLEISRKIAKRMGLYRPDKIFRVLKLKEKLTHELPYKKFVQFD